MNASDRGSACGQPGFILQPTSEMLAVAAV